MREPSGFKLVNGMVCVAVLLIAPTIIGNADWLPVSGSWSAKQLNLLLYAVSGIVVLVVHALLDASDRRSARKKLNSRQRKRQRRLERRAIEENANEATATEPIASEVKVTAANGTEATANGPSARVSLSSETSRHVRSGAMEGPPPDCNREPDESGIARQPREREIQ